MDVYGGLTYTMDAWSFDAGFIYYAYPGADDSLDYDFVELQGKIGYAFPKVAAVASINYSPDYFASSGDAYYYKLALSAPLPHDFAIDGYIAYQDIDDEDAFGVPDYAEWGVGLAYSFEGLTLKATYIDTDLDNDECADGCDEKVIGSLSRKF